MQTIGQIQQTAEAGRGLDLLTLLNNMLNERPQDIPEILKVNRYIQDFPSGSPYDAYKGPVSSLVSALQPSASVSLHSLLPLLLAPLSNIQPHLTNPMEGQMQI